MPKHFVLPHQEWPFRHAEVFATENGTRCLKEPGAIVIGQTATNLDNVDEFLRDFDFEEYLEDPTLLPHGEALAKFGGQICYMSLGKQRSTNADAPKYIGHIMESGHGSVIEHASASVLIYGISRSLTHELVRHRAGTAFSQLSQRYVSGRLLRFVERPEYQDDPTLHAKFERWIDLSAKEYDERAQHLLAMQEGGSEMMTAERKTDMRKKVNQAARSCLPNETETIMVFTGNVRAWRHIFEMRASEGAEVEIRRLIFLCFELLREVWPILTQDYEVVLLSDGTKAVQTKYRKV
jgi:thymidylate synthase, flavin-dependent